jgi:transcriptional regulator with XRE-family HTH domain
MAGKIQINRLKIVLAEKDVSQKLLAKMVKRTPTTISLICNNESQPTLLLLRQIAIALNVDIKDLLYSTKVK